MEPLCVPLWAPTGLPEVPICCCCCCCCCCPLLKPEWSREGDCISLMEFPATRTSAISFWALPFFLKCLFAFSMRREEEAILRIGNGEETVVSRGERLLWLPKERASMRPPPLAAAGLPTLPHCPNLLPSRHQEERPPCSISLVLCVAASHTESPTGGTVPSWTPLIGAPVRPPGSPELSSPCKERGGGPGSPLGGIKNFLTGPTCGDSIGASSWALGASVYNSTR